MRYKKYFTVKAWNKFDLTAQDVLCCRYDIILTDYKTRNEKIIHVLKKFNRRNLNRGIKTFNKGVNNFTKMTDDFDRQVFGPKKRSRVI
jgi:hypothetical protein